MANTSTKRTPKGKGLHNERGVEQNPLSQKETELILSELCAHLMNTADGPLTSYFLLLLYALGNEHREEARGMVYYKACAELAPVIDGIAEAYKVDHEETLASIRARASLKGGAHV